MVTIKKQLANTNKHYGTGNTRKYITIHETDNWSYGANAQMHRNYVNGNSPSTYHYVVDDKHAIQILEHDIMCWHAGDGRGSGNTESIAIEICVNRDGNYNKAVQNAIELTKHIMYLENIPVSNVVQHNHWSGKNCPRALRHGRNGITWKDFKNALGDDYLSIPTSDLDDLVARTIAGEFGNGETRKRALGDMYKPVQDVINGKVPVNKPDIKTLVNETLAGKHGNGATRKRSLGKHYDEVQGIINSMYSTPRVNIDDLVRRTLAGEFGNGTTRKRNLGKHYRAVQNKINKLYR